MGHGRLLVLTHLTEGTTMHKPELRGRRGFLAAACTLTCAAAGIALLAAGVQRQPPAPAPIPNATFSLAAPPSAPARAQDAQKAIGSPRLQAAHIYAPALGINAPWVSEPLTLGSLAIPSNVHTAGLSSAGAQPGAVVGTILLASHVNYVGQGAGAFAPLYRASAGELVILTDDRGTASRWRVTGLAAPSKADLDPSIFSATGPLRLVLVTCGGNVHNGEYDRNVVLTAQLEQGTNR